MLTIIVDPLENPVVLAFLAEHQQEMAAVCPPETNHSIGVTELKKAGVLFWTAWQEQKLLGCIALKPLSKNDGELKSFRTSSAARGKGVGAKLLAHAIDFAVAAGYARLFLETGSALHFAAARRLFDKFNFEVTGPFADYSDDPSSVFMCKYL